MLPTTLNTNEVKTTAGVEIEFNRLENNGRSVLFAKNGEAPDAEHRILVSHQESGTGSSKRRRSVVRVDITSQPGDLGIASASATAGKSSAYAVIDLPVGKMTTTEQGALALANLISLLASTGADTTVKFDCSGTAASSILNGSL